MRKRNILLTCALALILLSVLAACGNSTELDLGEDEGEELTLLAPSAVTPENDEAVIVGRVISTADGGRMPLAQTTVWLGTVHYNEDRSEGAYFIDGSASPSTFTDSDGSFAFRDLEAREYVIVVGDLNGLNAVLQNEDGSARIYTPVLGEVLDVETLEVELSLLPIVTPLPAVPYPEPGQSPADSPAYP
jgi:hypothetical protein